MEIRVFDDLAQQLQHNLSYERFIHTLGVAYTAHALALCWEYEPAERAFIAGLLHDCAKYEDKNQMYAEAEEHLAIIDEFDRDNPSLIHAKIGPFIAQRDYGIYDTEVQDAIRYHTTGRPKMTMLEKIIYVADYIEPLREFRPNITKIAELAFEDIDLCILMIMENVLNHLEEEGKLIAPITKKAYEFYKQIIDEREDDE